MPDIPLVAIYADESCLGNGREGDNPGGAGGLVEYVRSGSGELTRWDYWSSSPATTNNRMALQSVIDGFTLLSRKGRRFRVCFTSDSQYLVKGMSEWVHGWMHRGWKRKGGPIENLELWQEAVESVRPHKVSWHWVRGHVGHPQNEYANHLATRAARELDASPGLVPSDFTGWLAGERERGRDHGDPAAFPDPGAFRPARPFPAAIAAAE
jgi:ribonuclease HI